MKCLKRHKIQSSNFLIRFKGHKITLKLLQDLNTFYQFVHFPLYRSVTNSSQTGRHPQTTASSAALAFCHSECVLRASSGIWELARNGGFQAVPQGAEPEVPRWCVCIYESQKATSGKVA